MKKKTAKKKTVKRKAAAGKKTVARKKVSQQKTTVKKKPKRTSTAARKKIVKPSRSLGRPRVSADAKLELMFQKDYQAREIFNFLGVTTVRELEEYSPDEIIEKLTGPMVQTVQRIRKALAVSHRCLTGDRNFALKFLSQLQ